MVYMVPTYFIAIVKIFKYLAIQLFSLFYLNFIFILYEINETTKNMQQIRNESVDSTYNYVDIWLRWLHLSAAFVGCIRRLVEFYIYVVYFLIRSAFTRHKSGK